MRDRKLYEQILGLPEPWHVTDVELRDEASEVIVEVGLGSSLRLSCPECREKLGLMDEVAEAVRAPH